MLGGYKWDRTLCQTVHLSGRDQQYLHLLGNSSQRSGLPLPPDRLSEDRGKFVLAVFIVHQWCVMVDFCLVDE